MLYDSKKWDYTPKYLTAEQLGVNEATREAFIAVHQAMLRGEIPQEKFTMEDVGTPSWEYKDCGTPGCLEGWAQAYADMKWGLFSNEYIYIDCEVGCGTLANLCYPSWEPALRCTDPVKACRALGNWLTTGHARWCDALRNKVKV